MPENQLRIIGGKWRNRRLAVCRAPGLRPTLTRLRETLFNWLQDDLHGARCLDLYAGSGALGLEALSRGAHYVDFVEKNVAVGQHLSSVLQLLEATNAAAVHCCSATQYLKHSNKPYDVMFLDPPFMANHWALILDTLWQSSELLNTQAKIYLEAPLDAAGDIESALVGRWQWHRKKTTSQLLYGLLVFI